jgi:hypothetical protein
MKYVSTKKFSLSRESMGGDALNLW